MKECWYQGQKETISVKAQIPTPIEHSAMRRFIMNHSLPAKSAINSYSKSNYRALFGVFRRH
jgi:hypothetical protein